MVHLSHWYMTAGKNVPLIIWSFVSKVMFLFFNMLYRFAIAVDNVIILIAEMMQLYQTLARF